ncbi:uncharacterized protein DUF3816 [Anaerobacterium chartisolvens]|uniref:Uncharacterized protein DUF3816 n=1 Tax=Anaerobacterium chartisolvens TaxID=1297424 RepID=A0A369B7C8_9FIRM|nr:ECF transporter S component [Anaerobacterium chartisolvens]RCX17215.1 uncharacterized protein DUF3816 [Anaerobacterium chartisolvens]
MRNKSVKEIVMSGLFIAMGILLPIVFHAFGMGSTFLPMHIPVLLAGFIVSLPFAIAAAVATPVLSSLLTGMPPAFPVLLYMVFELAAYGAVANLLYRKLKLNAYIALIGSMIAGRIVCGAIVWILATFFMVQLPAPVLFIIGSITKSIPGIVIQLILIPPLILILAKNNLITREGLTSES